MSKLGNVTIEVSNFLTDPRLSLCKNMDCKYNMATKNGKYSGELLCHLRVIELDENGKCQQLEKKEQTECQK